MLIDCKLNLDQIRKLLDQICDLYPMVRQYVSRYVPQGDVDDVVQDIMEGIIRALRNFRGNAKLETFAITVAHNKVVDYWRKRRQQEEALPMLPHPDFPGDRLPVDEMEYIPSQEIPPDESVIRKEIETIVITELQVFLERLKLLDPHRAIAYRRHRLDGESEAEIARSMNVNRSTISRWVSDADRKFRARLERRLKDSEYK